MKLRKLLLITFSSLFIASCSNSVTNVWDYYIKNNVEVHKYNDITESKSKMLYRKQEAIDKSQLELIAFKQDSIKYLVIGSHKVAKAFIMGDSLYQFDVKNLYSHVRGNDFIRQLGDLSIFFAHISANECNNFLLNWDAIKNKYMKAMPRVNSNEVLYIDYGLSHGIYLSFAKTDIKQPEPTECILWIGKRKHTIRVEELLRVFRELKSFN